MLRRPRRMTERGTGHRGGAGGRDGRRRRCKSLGELSKEETVYDMTHVQYRNWRRYCVRRRGNTRCQASEHPRTALGFIVLGLRGGPIRHGGHDRCRGRNVHDDRRFCRVLEDDRVRAGGRRHWAVSGWRLHLGREPHGTLEGAILSA